MLTCIKCGQPDTEGSRFCTYCGATLVASQLPPTAIVTPPPAPAFVAPPAPPPAPRRSLAEIAAERQQATGRVAPPPAHRPCAACGHAIPAGVQFCTVCGTQIMAAALAPPPPPFARAPLATNQTPPNNLVGYTLEGKYRLDAVIGAGGMGTVYRATRLLIGDAIAIKVLHPAQLAAPHALERFRREAQAAARLKHPNAVTIYDFGVAADGQAFLAMELVEGQSLRALLKQQGPLTPPAAAEVLQQACAALDEAHRQQIVHRDVKPDNIIVNASPAGLRVKVLDFGIAKLRDLSATATSLTQTGSVMGTPYYMSPEHCLGEELDHRSDIYSLGIVLFEMLAGVVPFNAPAATAIVVAHVNQAPPALRAINANLSPAVEAVVMRALEKRREARPQTAVQLAQELIAAVQGRPLTPHSGSMPVSALYSTPPTPAAKPLTGAGLATTIKMTTPPVISGARAAAPAKKRLPLMLVAAVVIMMAAIVIAALIWARREKNASPSVGAKVTSFKVGESISFPIVELSDQAKADRINAYLKDRYKSADSDSKNTFQEELASYDELNYKVVLNTPNILAIEIATSSGRAGDRTQHHFDLSTGYSFTLDQIVMPSKWDEIRKLVCNDSKKRLVQAKNEIKKGRGNSWYEKGMLGKSYEDGWQEEMKKEYWGIELSKDFTLSKDGIGFHYFTMGFIAEAIRADRPDTEYFYSWAVLKPFLMPASPISSLLSTQSVEAANVVATPTPLELVVNPQKVLEEEKQALPQFRTGTPYREVRKKLMTLGWQPVTLPSATPCGDDDRCRGFSEVYFCVGTGQAQCIYMWTKKTTLIRIVARGEGDQRYERVAPCQSLHPTQIDFFTCR